MERKRTDAPRTVIAFRVANQPIERNENKNVIFDDISLGAERFPVPVVLDRPVEMDTGIFTTFTYSSRILDRSGYIIKPDAAPTFACTCIEFCDESCECSNGIYTKGGRVTDMDEMMSQVIHECTWACNCGLWCGNRVAQKGSFCPVEIFARDASCGWGVRAASSIPSHSFLGEYTGELIDDDEVARRQDSTFLFETRVGKQPLTIDAKFTGNYTRFVNHSCEPNCKVANISWDYSEDQLVHMCLFALDEIEKGTELTIDYGDGWWTNKKFPCACSSRSCRFSRKSLSPAESL